MLVFLAVLDLVEVIRATLVAVHGLLIAVTSPLGQGLSGTWASVTVAHGLCSCISSALEHKLNRCGLQA